MDNPLLDVLHGKMPAERPIWFMRQAGRYLPEYRDVRARAGSFLDLCYNPTLACEVTLQPVHRFDVNAAILFADILVVPHAMGLGVRFEEGEGPVLEKVKDLNGVFQLKSLKDSEEVHRVCETVGKVRARLDNRKTLIGFCGGPWTVASYMIEGGSSDRVRAKVAALRGESWFRALIERLVVESVSYLSAQIVAGAQVVQIFDSWAGELIGDCGEEFVIKPLTQIVAELKVRHPEIPVILFARGFGFRHARLAEASGASCIGVESEYDLSLVVSRLSDGVSVQGNLDPVVLLAGRDVVMRESTSLVARIPMNRHVFNLGHGIRVGTDPEALGWVIEAVRNFDGR